MAVTRKAEPLLTLPIPSLPSMPLFFKATKNSGLYDELIYFFMNFRLSPTSPNNPDARRRMAGGMGTAEVVIVRLPVPGE